MEQDGKNLVLKRAIEMCRLVAVDFEVFAQDAELDLVVEAFGQGASLGFDDFEVFERGVGLDLVAVEIFDWRNASLGFGDFEVFEQGVGCFGVESAR